MEWRLGLGSRPLHPRSPSRSSLDRRFLVSWRARLGLARRSLALTGNTANVAIGRGYGRPAPCFTGSVTGEWLRVSDLASVQRRLNRFGREQVEYLHAKFANDFDDLPVPPV